MKHVLLLAQSSILPSLWTQAGRAGSIWNSACHRWRLANCGLPRSTPHHLYPCFIVQSKSAGGPTIREQWPHMLIRRSGNICFGIVLMCTKAVSPATHKIFASLCSSQETQATLPPSPEGDNQKVLWWRAAQWSITGSVCGFS